MSYLRRLLAYIREELFAVRNARPLRQPPGIVVEDVMDLESDEGVPDDRDASNPERKGI